MKVSVIVATYNRKDKLPRCLYALENQDYPVKDYEILVVDNGSTDGTYEFLENRKRGIRNLRVSRQYKRGPAAARNMGIKNAKGEIIFFTDDDVIVPRNWIKALLVVFSKHKDVAAAGGYIEASDEVLRSNILAKYESYMSRTTYSRPHSQYIGGFETPGISTCNAAYRKSVLDEAGGFDENFPVPAGEDSDLKLRVSLMGYKFVFVPIKATHIQDYTMKRFWNQQKARGLGNEYFLKKWTRLSREEKEKYNASPKISIPFRLIKELRFAMLFLFIVSLVAARLGRRMKK